MNRALVFNHSIALDDLVISGACAMTSITTERRCWLLAEALKVAPLREALEIARQAEAFLSGIDETSITTAMTDRRAIRLLH